MSRFEHAYSVRETVINRLEEDLLGGDLDAELTEDPLDRFVAGVLYPDTQDSSGELGGQTDSVEDEREGDKDYEVAANAPDGAEAQGVALSKVRFPRSFGVTFALDAAGPARIELKITAAKYASENADEGKKRWVRNPLEPQTIEVDCSASGAPRQDIAEDLELLTIIREPREGIISVTVSLINKATAERGHKDAKCWFNPHISVLGEVGAFCARPPLVQAGDNDTEKESQRLLHRSAAAYAVGHGCAAIWSTDASGSVVQVDTTFVPRHELLLSKASGGETLAMMELAKDASDFAALDGLVSNYRDWISGLSASDLDDAEATTLRRHRREASEVADRMQAGIELIRSDADVRRAFELMNLAMAEQRSRQEWHRKGNIGDPPAEALSEAKWRPFQMGFILVNLAGLADGEHPDRKLADLLWFPTGGGKTEAYLGLIAIAILLRRLRGSNAGGVSVLMRYTLRLLTLQQYQRATGLICALEKLRGEHLRDTRHISIGLWVGQGSTPNSIDDAKSFLNNARRGRTPSETDEDRGDPMQLRQCPWCGTALDHNNYDITQQGTMKVACNFDDCAFRNSLPVHIVDEDVYRERPSLVISTVDKFAMLPWKQEAGNLLGAGPGDAANGNLAPDLIVQDELHLISGPLGTMVGLYETAIDSILSKVNPPKIVASTATIRRASQQVRAVFARESRQFPPPGLSQTDSFFAEQAGPEEMGSREYVGVMAPGASHATLMVRVYASLLQSASAVPMDDEEGRDLFWTLLGYFNSLRVLGGAYIQVLDDVPDQMGVIARRRAEEVRDRPEVREMTSRKKSSEIPRELQILEKVRGDKEAADVVLATNMISVGVDVDRLGLMAVMGQPPTSSEYIQATSRVGRRMPGLVVTLYNAARSRDLSHYENFSAYHQMLYLHVEATGATPFAPRARDRALHAVLVSLARHTIADAGHSKAAAHAEDWESELQAAAQVIVDRAEVTRDPNDFRPEDESAERIMDQLQDRIADWVDGHPDHYEGWFDRAPGALLVEAARMLAQPDSAVEMDFPPQSPPWPTLTSMRNVDAESSLYLLKIRRSSRAK